ncbi:hypothetical protein F8388_025092 [Cannabis sativa]|uniref:ENT domain-containing protein n=1 Tax=Cannabis sativa TaxID=3483 RepID=A0A7J6FJ19_CANSA|nr:hypothetical protein F8388_025092 [Cannabis sativa]
MNYHNSDSSGTGQFQCLTYSLFFPLPLQLQASEGIGAKTCIPFTFIQYNCEWFRNSDMKTIDSNLRPAMFGGKEGEVHNLGKESGRVSRLIFSVVLSTDDDIPPSHQNRVPRGSRVAGNERSAVGSISYPRMYADMETQIHNLEQEAYCAVLRAFVAQSDALTWEKEGLITELRKELRVSDDEHRELLTRVNADDIVSKIREWRKSGGNQSVRLNQSQSVYDVLPSPTVLTSRKKQRISQTGHQFPGLSSMKSIHTPSTGLVSNRSFLSRSSSGIPPEDIQWDGADLVISHGGNHGGHGRGHKKPSNRGGAIPGSGRGRGPSKVQPKKDFPPTQNGIAKKVSDDIELLNTDALVKEVETVFSANHPDPFELEKAKKMLKEHEQALIDAIAKLAYSSDGESDGGHPFLYGQSVNRE